MSHIFLWTEIPEECADMIIEMATFVPHPLAALVKSDEFIFR